MWKTSSPDTIFLTGHHCCTLGLAFSTTGRMLWRWPGYVRLLLYLSFSVRTEIKMYFNALYPKSLHLFLICKAWRIHYIVIPTSTRVSQILTKHSWSYLILDRFSMQWTYFGMHLTNPPQKIGDCRENQKGTFRLGSVCKGTRLTEGKKTTKKHQVPWRHPQTREMIIFYFGQ